MSDVQQPNASGLQRTVLLLIVSAAVGAILIFAFGRYRSTLLDWVVADPENVRRRASLVFFVAAGLLAGPLLLFAAYLWSFGAKVVRARAFPPPGHRTIRDAPALAGDEAVQRGRGFKLLGMFLAAAAVLLWLLLWRLAGLFASRPQ
jgi:hypothetical protein